MKSLKVLLCREQDSMPTDIGGRLVIIFFNAMEEFTAKERIVQRFWAIPNLANVFLSKGIFISPAMLHLRDQGLPAPRERFIGFNQLDPATIIPKDMKLPFLYLKILHLFFHIAAGKAYDTGHVRATTLSVAILRTRLEAWKDPFARASVPIYNEEDKESIAKVRCFLFHDAFRIAIDQIVEPESSEDDLSPFLKNDELAPGITVKEFFVLVLADESLYFTLPRSSKHVILFLTNKSLGLTVPCMETAWKSFSASDRIEVMDLLNRSEHSDYLATVLVAPGKRMLAYLLETAVGISTRTLPRLQDLARSMTVKPSEETLGVLANVHESLLDAETESGGPRALVHMYHNLVHEYHRTHYSAQDFLPDMPSELLTHIADFLLSPYFVHKNSIR